jgi:hypothetical protein
MRGKCLGIRGIDSCHGNPLFRRDALDQDYLDALEVKWQGTWLSFIYRLWGLIDYGRSLWRVAVIAAIVVLAFGVVYSLYPEFSGRTKDAVGVFTPFYQSFKAFAFGDITPSTTLGEVLVTIEAILGYTTLGLLVAVLAEKVARRS